MSIVLQNHVENQVAVGLVCKQQNYHFQDQIVASKLHLPHLLLTHAESGDTKQMLLSFHFHIPSKSCVTQTGRINRMTSTLRAVSVDYYLNLCCSPTMIEPVDC